MAKRSSDSKIQTDGAWKLVIAFFFVAAFWLLVTPTSEAQVTAEPIDVTSSNFSLNVCDGPRYPTGATAPTGYRPCDFNAGMRLIQHLINIMIVGGVLAAIAGFSYAGFLYITGIPSKITKATGIFKNVGLGFIMMLTAWVIVYQLLTWLTDNAAFKSLLGNP